MKTKHLLALALAATVAAASAETATTEQTVTTTNATAPAAATTVVQPATVGTATVTASQPTANVTVTNPAPAANVTVTAPGTGTGVATVTSPNTVTYETRAEAAYRAAGVPSDMIVKLRDYDVKIRDARIANDAALVKQYYTEEAGLLNSQQINGVRTYLKANPVAPTATSAVTVWEDPAYVSVASPATVVNPTTIVTNEVRTPPVVTRQVQVPVASGAVPVVVKDPVPVVRTEVSAPAVVKTETVAPAVNTITQTEEKTKIRTESKSSEHHSSSESKDSESDDDKKKND
jgi:hypothetical protein